MLLVLWERLPEPQRADRRSLSPKVRHTAVITLPPFKGSEFLKTQLAVCVISWLICLKHKVCCIDMKEPVCALCCGYTWEKNTQRTILDFFFINETIQILKRCSKPPPKTPDPGTEGLKWHQQALFCHCCSAVFDPK